MSTLPPDFPDLPPDEQVRATEVALLADFEDVARSLSRARQAHGLGPVFILAVEYRPDPLDPESEGDYFVRFRIGHEGPISECSILDTVVWVGQVCEELLQGRSH